jgi:hypothetical protein
MPVMEAKLPIDNPSISMSSIAVYYGTIDPPPQGAVRTRHTQSLWSRHQESIFDSAII